MREKNDNGIIRFIVGLAFGIVAGYVSGILTANKPGRELRRDIEITSADLINNLKDKFEDFKEQTSDAIKEFKGFTDEKLKASAKNIEQQVNSLGKQLEELTHRQASSVNN